MDSKNGKLRVRHVVLTDVADLHQIINWAYRGKPGVPQWTGEADLIEGDRISQHQLSDLIASEKNGKAYHLLALEDRTEGDWRLRGCMKIELHDEGGAAEFGMFAIDPSFAGSGYGGQLMSFAIRWAKESLGCALGIITVISIRRDLIEWYSGKLGFHDSGKRIPFPGPDACVGQPRPEIVAKHGWLEFAVYTRRL